MALKDHFVESNGNIRPATEQEVATARSLREQIRGKIIEMNSAQQQLNRLMASCNHHVRYDEEGFPYDVRRCFACNTSLGAI